MRLPVRIARRARSFVRKRVRYPALILLYHSVSTPEADPWEIAVAPRHFSEHLEVLRRVANPLPLAAIVSAVAAGSVPAGAVAVTFDDGYADNLHAALPLLERHDVPATFFLTGDVLRDGVEFWWDALARYLLHRRELPAQLHVQVGGRERVFQFRGDDRPSEQWRASQPAMTSRELVYLELWRDMADLDSGERLAILETLAAWSGVDEREALSHRALSAAEVTRLAASPLVEIGAHTLTHARLSALDPGAQRHEIDEGRRLLEAHVGRTVNSFAYPFGRPADYTSTTTRVVRELGFGCACINTRGGITSRTDRWQLPRLYVRDVDGDALGATLAEWLRPARTSPGPEA